MLVSVTGATGSFSWLGETWNFPADSGVEKEVAPTAYVKQKDVNATNQWTHSVSGLDYLKLQRDLTQSNVTLNRNGSPFATSFKNSTSSFYYNMNTPPSLFNNTPATLSDYLITDSFFGSATNSSGNILSWRKGNGWP